jgi:hypothetical protein
MTEEDAARTASLIVKLLRGEGRHHVPSADELAEHTAREKMSWEQKLEHARQKVKTFSVGDRVTYPMGGPGGMLFVGTVDEIHELWIGVRGEDGGAYVCPPFCGIQKIKT